MSSSRNLVNAIYLRNSWRYCPCLYAFYQNISLTESYTDGVLCGLRDLPLCVGIAFIGKCNYIWALLVDHQTSHRGVYSWVPVLLSNNLETFISGFCQDTSPFIDIGANLSECGFGKSIVANTPSCRWWIAHNVNLSCVNADYSHHSKNRSK